MAGNVLPLAPDTIVISAGALTAYEQDEPEVVRVTLPVPPLAGKVNVDGVTVSGHGLPDWVTTIGRWSNVSSTLLGEGVWLGITALNETVPGPVPETGDGTSSQVGKKTGPVHVHAHVLDAVRIVKLTGVPAKLPRGGICHTRGSKPVTQL